MLVAEPAGSPLDVEHSDFVVYVDESGDHSLGSIDPEYPIFVLSFCVFQKDIYSDTVTPAIRKLKFATFGHDMVVLHENDIRRKRGAFSRLSKELREAFQDKLTEIIVEAKFTLIAVVIDKLQLKEHYRLRAHPYHLAMEFGLERIHHFLREAGQSDALTYLVCEARGAKEDKELELEFLRIRDGDNYCGKRLSFELIIADKKTNSEGLQVADLTARPIGLSVLRPNQPNRTRHVLEAKFYGGGTDGNVSKGLKIFPEKQKDS